MGKYTHKKRIYGGIPPTPPPLPPSSKKSKETLEFEKKYKKRLDKIYEKMKEADEDERRAETEDSLMFWAVRGTGKKYEPISKKWKTAVAQSKKRGGKKTRKHRKHRK
jgi:hypothetical protein